MEAGKASYKGIEGQKENEKRYTKMNQTDTKTLTPKQIAFIKAYTTENNLEAVYKTAGVSKGAYYSWLKNDELFREALTQATKNTLKGLTDRLNALGYLAINALEAELKNNNPANRIRSAQLLLEFLYKYQGLNLLDRLEDLENRLDEQEGKRREYH